MTSGITSDVLDCADAAQWEAWLAHHHDLVSEAWLVIAKKDGGADAISIGDALDVAMGFGWIDSHRKGRDRLTFLQRYSPRRARSPWSHLNVQRAEALIGQGRMKEAGLKEVQAAQADGRWASAYEPQSQASIPTELVSALNMDRGIALKFNALSRSARYALMLPILKASSSEARARRVEKALQSLSLLPDVAC